MDAKVRLSGSEVFALAGALRVAAEVYKVDAEKSAAWPRIAEAFKEQATKALDLAERIENSDFVEVI